MAMTDDRSTGDLLKQLSEQTSTLVRQELELAKTEMAEKGKQAGLGAGMFGGAGLFGLLSLIALTACFIVALDHAVSDWLAALIVAAVYAAVAGVFALIGRNKVREAAPAVPEQTVDTLREDVEWAKTQKQSAAR
jgi:uncharacterized membrane protein YqjE